MQQYQRQHGPFERINRVRRQMSRIVTIEGECDKCNKRGAEADMHMDVLFPELLGVPAFVVDLCAEDHTEVRLFLETLFGLGHVPQRGSGAAKAPPKPKAKAAASTKREAPSDGVRCGYPGCDFIGKTGPGAGAHRARAHGIPGREEQLRRDRLANLERQADEALAKKQAAWTGN